MMAAITLGGTTSCKSKKKLAREQAAAEYAARLDQAKKDLTAILNDQTSWSLDEKEQRFAIIKEWNLQDEEVQNLIPLVADKLARERAEAERKAEEERLRKAEEEKLKASAAKYATIENHFLSIAASPNMAVANEKINQALQLFATPDAPVLIIISQAGGFNDYDRPTTIRRYLDYLKDQKVFNNRIEQVKYDANGKITEIEMIKK
jgi:glutamate mutase epsilon subunit